MAKLPTSAALAFRGRRFVRRLVATILLLVVFAAGVWLERAALLQGAANLWTVSDPVTRSDAVVVLGGGADMRAFVAAELYKKGLVTRVLVSQVATNRSDRLLAIPGRSESNRMILQKLGVPDADIEMFGDTSKNMKEEAVALRDWANRHDVSSIVIPTEIFASRRARWILNREFTGSSARLELPAFEPGYTRADWWKTDEGMIAFYSELMRYLYYRLRY
jgi:uncharacterized SAM-binding protein YcdF (DUF218 family)